MPTYGRIVLDDSILRDGFIQFPRKVWRSADLKARAKLVYGSLLWFGWKDQGYPGHAAIAADCGLSEASIYRSLRELEALGLISVEREGLGKTNSYHILPLADQSAPAGVRDRDLNLTNQRPHDDESDPSGRGNNALRLDSQERIDSSEEPKDNDADPPQDNHGLACWIAREFAPREKTQAVVAYLGRFSGPVLRQAADLTRAAGAALERPIAYLFAVAKDLVAQEALGPAAQGRPACLDEPEPSDEERAAAHQAFELVKLWVQGGCEGPCPVGDED